MHSSHPWRIWPSRSPLDRPEALTGSTAGASGASARIASDTEENTRSSSRSVCSRGSGTIGVSCEGALSKLGCERLHDLILDRYNIEATTIFLLAGNMWVRISAQIYNDMNDIEYLGNAVLEIIHSTMSSL